MSENTIFPKGKIIIKQGRRGTSAFIIAKGKAQVILEDENGKKKLLAVLKEQDIFGEMGLIDGRPRSATVVALEDCECSVITKEMFKNLPDSNPGVKAIKKIMENRLKKI
jgi:CRP/FNR family transcriptional regulator, cyclic AMP receptor protein